MSVTDDVHLSFSSISTDLTTYPAGLCLRALRLHAVDPPESAMRRNRDAAALPRAVNQEEESTFG